MSQTTWIIDADLFEHYRDRLIKAIRDQGHKAAVIHPPAPPYRWDDVGNRFLQEAAEDACVVSHGDIELCTRIKQHSPWTPGAFCTVDNFFWSKYAAQLRDFLLNHDYTVVLFDELSSKREQLFAEQGLKGQIFLRPDSPLKLFTGQTASEATFDADLDFMGFYDFPRDSPVIVSSPKAIAAEWRFVIADKAVLAGCQYSRAGEPEIASDFPRDALRLAQRVAEQPYQPAPVWIADICRTEDGDYRLLEIGGFSFSDLYACNVDEIAREVSRCAQDVWSRREG